MRTAHEGLIGQILTMNVLRIQAVWSHHRLRRHNRLLNFLLHRQLRLISLISSQRRMLQLADATGGAAGVAGAAAGRAGPAWL